MPSDQKFKALIRLPNGTMHQVIIMAPAYHIAIQLAEAQYGKANVVGVTAT